MILGDTGIDGGIFLLTDEEIDEQLDRLPFGQAVSFLAMSLASRFAQYPDETTDASGAKYKWGERVAQWRRLGEGKGLVENPTANAPGQRPLVGQLQVGRNKIRP